MVLTLKRKTLYPKKPKTLVQWRSSAMRTQQQHDYGPQEGGVGGGQSELDTGGKQSTGQVTAYRAKHSIQKHARGQ